MGCVFFYDGLNENGFNICSCKKGGFFFFFYFGRF